MGNQTAYPTFDYPLPQPSDDSWSSYLRHCSLRQFENLMYSFETKYKGKIVEWEGTVATASDKKVQFIMNPSESSRTRYDITLTLDSETRQTYPEFVVGETRKFRGRLDALGTYRTHKLTGVPLNSSEPVIPFTWLDFCLHFGLSAQKSADLFFEKYFENRPMFITGVLTSRSMLAHEEKEGGIYNLVDFNCTDLDPSVHPEPIKLRAYRYAKDVVKNLNALIESKETVTVCVSVLKRKCDYHDLRLHCFIPPSFKSEVSSAEGNEAPKPQYITWDYAPDDFHVSAMADGNVKDDEPQPAQNPEFTARMDLGSLPSAPLADKIEIIS
ncbi:hypothetical protein BLNAU_15002 [Blattamonas nauphoetae]|uniref:Uncharacterized protein n=1 Tax=Blattamonas nauphoetae TaxID=2049346 RepID=A0ABQ9XIS6_9EUKA|nr:hypothetical protein BLNAU_15002 [Blattamonas nauphoetae]